METSHPAGWLPDPMARYQYRYWTGGEWTDRVSTNGSNEIDPHGLAPNPAVTTVASSKGSPPRLSWSTDLRVLIFGSAAALLVGALLPWVKAEAGIFSVTKNGIDGDGVITLLLGGGITLAFLLTRAPKTAAWLVIALAGLATAVAAYDTIDISKKAEDLTNRSSFIHVSATVGVGLWLSLAGGVVALVGGILALRRGPANVA